MARPLVLRPAATELEWQIVKGETYDIHVPVLDEHGDPVDVSAYTAKAQVRHSERDAVLHEWADDTIECVGTEVVLHVRADETSAWQFTSANFSIETYAPVTSAPRVIAQGVIHALPEYTQ